MATTALVWAWLLREQPEAPRRTTFDRLAARLHLAADASWQLGRAADDWVVVGRHEAPARRLDHVLTEAEQASLFPFEHRYSATLDLTVVHCAGDRTLAVLEGRYGAPLSVALLPADTPDYLADGARVPVSTSSGRGVLAARYALLLVDQAEQDGASPFPPVRSIWTPPTLRGADAAR